ncbi:MAG: ABC transporter substrate-binding protein [Minisyncoccota bacterium]
MKVTLFQGILFGIFGFGAVIGIVVFATHSSNTNNTNTVGSVVIWGTLPKQKMQIFLTAAGQADQTLKDVSYIQKNPATLPNDLSAAIATGNAPDLVLDSQEDLISLTKFIAPIPSTALSASTFVNTFIEEGKLFAVPNGGYYGIPFLVDPIVLYSNRTILSSSGIAKPPETWEALTGLVPNIAVLTPTQQVTRGLIALGTYDNIHDARGILSTIFLQTGVPISSYATNGLLAADLGERTTNGTPPGQAVIGFYTQFADPSKVSYTWNASLQDSQQEFLAGDLALYLGYASEASFLTQANPNLDFDVTPVPQPATATAKNVYSLLYAFMIPNGAKNPAGAYQVASLFTNSAEQTAAAAATGLAPATLNQLAQPPADPVAAIAYAEALYASGWLSPVPANTDAVFSSMIGNVTSGRSSIGMALASAEQTLNSYLQQP